MIIEKHKAIFIHIPKTAGSALSVYFNDKGNDKYGLSKHDNIDTIKVKFPKHKEYRKFTIVRNPYDKAVSCYFYSLETDLDLNGAIPLNFIKWIENPLNADFTNRKLLDPQYTFIDETVTILKYENLNKELSKFFKEEINLPQHNKSNLKKEYFLNYYNKHALGIVYERYKEDFEKFNYNKIEKI